MQEQNLQSDIAVVMGSQSDFATMSYTIKVLEELKISFKTFIVSAHRTPDRLYEFGKTAKNKGFKIIIAGAGGAAHLPGMIAALTVLPVIGVPIKSKTLNGIDSLLSIVQMPKGIPVATMSIGCDGAHNAAVMASSILSITDSGVALNLESWRNNNTNMVKNTPDNIF